MVLTRTAACVCAVVFLAAESDSMAQSPTDSPPSLLLEDVLERVRNANPTLAAERHAAAAAHTRALQVSSWRDPMISATVNAGPGRMQRGQLMLEQPLPWPDVLRERARAADAAAIALDHGGDAVLDDLLLEATDAYVEAAGIELQLAQIDHFRDELAAFEQAAAAQYESGAGPQQAILRTQLEKNGLLQRRLALTARHASLRRTLERLAGRQSTDDWSERSLVLPPIPAHADPRDAREAARRRPEWRALESTRARVDAELALARKAFRPDISARFSWMEGAIMRNGQDAVGIGLGLRVPLWRAPRRAAIEEKELETMWVEAMMTGLENDVVTRQQALVESIETHRQAIRLLDGTLLPQGEATQKATAAAYTNGRADYADLLEAERILLTLRLDRIDHAVRLLQERARLDRIAPPAGTHVQTGPSGEDQDS